ncbi:hypothetical protein P9232_06990 [Weizmannia sp. CD-2023]|nr:hypothetical protein [Heyndrickxia coagulans]MED4321180.1 hypothetical protein [Weizmannia sp. CD-2023]UJZ87434.1 hypothetical protein L3V65_14730 [Heyndrickxia coagulans]
MAKKYSTLCFKNGTCCEFGKVKYNWCGPGCGSGKPVNALDSCCKSHDACYGKYKHYRTSPPNRCTCDANLIKCANKTSSPGKSVIIAAFVAKRAAFLC